MNNTSKPAATTGAGQSSAKLTKRQAAIVSAYTGYLVGSFNEMHGYIEEIIGRPVFTHEMGNKAFSEQIQEASKADFIALSPQP